MTPGDFDNELVAGFATLLEEAGLGDWRPDGSAVPTGVTAITQQGVPATPHDLLTLTPYSIDDDRTGTLSRYGLQIRTRTAGSSPRSTNRAAGLVFDVLQHRVDFTLPAGIRVYDCHRTSWTSLGQDSGLRWSRSDNYEVRLSRPTGNRE